MPTYEYACTACGQHVEVFQRLSEEPLTTCGVCGGPLRKVFHPAGIVFKGSGFYATDNRSKPKTGSSPGERSGTSTADGGSSDTSTTGGGSSGGSSSKQAGAGGPSKTAAGAGGKAS